MTLITALLFYVGWVRTDQVYEYFGVDLSIVGLSNQDYVLRSVEGIYLPLGVVFALALAGLRFHVLVRRLLVRARRRSVLSALAWALLGAGTVACLLGTTAVVRPSALPIYTLVVPLMLGAGIISLAYGRWLLECLRSIGTRGARWPTQSPVELTLVSLLVVLSLFWAASEFAAATGRGQAVRFASGASRPRVVIYSTQRLFLSAPGVIEQQIPEQPAAAYRWTYRGLTMLSESRGRLFLLPTGWGPGSPTFMLDYGPGMRIEFTPR